MKGTLTLLLYCIFIGVAAAQTTLAPKKTIEVIRIAEKIKLDAVLDEAAWQSTIGVSEFLLMWPTPGLPAAQKTVVKVIYDDEALYVSAHCYDNRPDSIFHRITKRDALENTDVFSITIDTYRDGQNAVQFGVTPDNVQFDSKFSVANANLDEDNSDGKDPAWDAVWASAARITDDGWIAEFEIPYSALRFPKKAIQEWGVNFYRSVKRNNETDSWNEVKAEISGTLSQLGIMQGIANIKSPMRLSATPFVAAYANNQYHQPGSSWSYPYSVGMDLKYGLNEAFTLDATLIPDFGQVRSDNNVLNLSPFEVRFQENRPFFTEGTELFNKGGLFYSRRIGATPEHYWDVFDAVRENEEIVENPNRVQLLNATKISGRTKKGLGIGLFNAIEAPSSALIRNVETGVTREIETASLSNRSILVFDQNLRNNSSVTLINTNVMRSGGNTDANVTGLLFNLKTKAQRYALNGKAVMSHRNKPDEQQTGYSASLDLSKTSGNVLWGAFYSLETDRYNPNDMGFLFNNNESSGNVWINYNRYKPWWKLNNFWTGLWAYQSALYRPANTWTQTQFGGNFGGNTRTFHNFGINFNVSPWGENDYFEPRTYDFVHFYHIPANGRVGGWYNSDNRKRITYFASAGVRFFDEKDRMYSDVEIGSRWRVSGKMSVGCSIGNELGRNDVGWVYADPASQGFESLGQGAIELGRRNILGFNNVLDLSYSFNTKMNLALYARHYWQQVQYKQFNHLMTDGNLEPSLYRGQSGSGQPINDIAANYFNIDLVYTWRFAPGSDLLLVYKNAIGHEYNGYDVRRNYFHNARNLPQYPGSNNLSIKILYYLDYMKLKKWF